MNTQPAPVFEINDYILHGGSGVCVVEDICIPESMRRIDASKKYYRLHPLYENNSVIYTPVDNPQSIMRKILSKEESFGLIGQIPQLEIFEIGNEKMRENTYRSALRTNDCRDWIRLIKTLYSRGESRKNGGKNANSVDDKYLKIAEDLLYGELSISMEMPKEEVQGYIAGQVMHLEPQCS